MTKKYRSSCEVTIFGERDPAILKLDVRFQGRDSIADP
jgi:hypothetical protein